MAKVGMTGTRKGMTVPQRRWFFAHLKAKDELHHGGAIGADAEAHKIAQEIGAKVVVHPSDMPEQSMNMNPRFAGEFEKREPKPPLMRNKDIVGETDHLYAFPKGYKEELRSGTWATIRHARRTKSKLTIVYPDGTTGK